MTRYAMKRDANDRDVYSALKRAGRNPERFTDFDIGAEHVSGYGLLLEVKTAKGRLRKKQALLARIFKDRYIVCRSPEEALKACGVSSYRISAQELLQG